MPRLPRIHLEGAIYYVTSKGSDGQKVFKDRADHAMYMDLMAKYKDQYRFKLFAWALAPEGLQLLIETSEDASISKIMHDLNSLYTKYYNSRYSRRGHLFEARFRSVLVEKAAHLLELTRLLHASSARVAVAAGAPETAPVESVTTSFPLYMGESSPAPDIRAEIAEVMDLLSAKDDPAAYERYCVEAPESEIEELARRLRRGSVLGSELFGESVKRRVEEHSREIKEEARLKRGPSRMVLLMAGALVVMVSATSVYLYISKEKIAAEYSRLLKEREAQFAEKTRFENRSPIALAELDGTVWQVEMLALPGEGGKIRDTVRFSNGRLQSEYFAARGFGQAVYRVSAQENGVFTWEATQINLSGQKVGWRGYWQGDNLKGVASHFVPGNPPRNFSFFGLSWAYAEAPRGEASS